MAGLRQRLGQRRGADLRRELLRDLRNLNLRAQTATTYEVGTRGVRPDLSWDLSLYRSKSRTKLQCLTTSIFSPCSIVNADRTVHQGVEAGLGVAFLKSLVTVEDRVWFNAAYTYNDFFFVRDALYGNNRLPGVPTHYLRAEVLYRHPSGFYAVPNVEWSPQSYFADNANSLTVPAYALLNLRIASIRARLGQATLRHAISWTSVTSQAWPSPASLTPAQRSSTLAPAGQSTEAFGTGGEDCSRPMMVVQRPFSEGSKRTSARRPQCGRGKSTWITGSESNRERPGDTSWRSRINAKHVERALIIDRVEDVLDVEAEAEVLVAVVRQRVGRDVGR